MAIPVLLAPLLKSLAANGLGLLANAITAKGKDVVEKTLGVSIPDDPALLDPAKLLTLRQAEMDHEETLRGFAIRELELKLEAEKVGIAAATERWQSDMVSDNKLSKNIRPMTLLILLAVTALLTVLDSVPALSIVVKPHWVDLWAGALMLVLGAYFVGRSIEKGMNMYQAMKSSHDPR